MRRTPRFFPSELPPSSRRVYRAATFLFLGIFLALIWPIYSRFSDIDPRILGLPFSLVYVVFFVLLSFLSLLALFAWEGRGSGD